MTQNIPQPPQPKPSTPFPFSHLGFSPTRLGWPSLSWCLVFSSRCRMCEWARPTYRRVWGLGSLALQVRFFFFFFFSGVFWLFGSYRVWFWIVYALLCSFSSSTKGFLVNFAFVFSLFHVDDMIFRPADGLGEHHRLPLQTSRTAEDLNHCISDVSLLWYENHPWTSHLAISNFAQWNRNILHHKMNAQSAKIFPLTLLRLCPGLFNEPCLLHRSLRGACSLSAKCTSRFAGAFGSWAEDYR